MPVKVKICRVCDSIITDRLKRTLCSSECQYKANRATSLALGKKTREEVQASKLLVNMMENVEFTEKDREIKLNDYFYTPQLLGIRTIFGRYGLVYEVKYRGQFAGTFCELSTLYEALNLQIDSYNKTKSLVTKGQLSWFNKIVRTIK